jgi:NADH-quinone oxidoreductase subunit J
MNILDRKKNIYPSLFQSFIKNNLFKINIGNNLNLFRAIILLMAHVFGVLIFFYIIAWILAYLGFLGEIISQSLLKLWEKLGLFALPTAIIFLSGLVILNTNPIYSLASLILVFFSAAIFLLSIKVTFLAMIYLIIYIGAIAILFLFVIMMFNLRNLKQGPGTTYAIFSYNFIFYCFTIWQFYTIFCHFIRNFTEYNNYFLLYKENSLSNLSYYLTYQHVDVLLFGTLLYTYYSYLFILAAFILLTAMLGAIVLALSASEQNTKKFKS